jgi:hypothetical protein
VFFLVRPEQFLFFPLQVLFFPAACFGQVCLCGASDLLCRSRFLRLIHRHLGSVLVRQPIFEAACLYLVWALGSRPHRNRCPAHLRCVLLRIRSADSFTALIFVCSQISVSAFCFGRLCDPLFLPWLGFLFSPVLFSSSHHSDLCFLRSVPTEFWRWLLCSCSARALVLGEHVSCGL